MYIIGLTGPIGAGKSTVSAVWEQSGVPIVDADVIAREVVAPGSECLRQLTVTFGNDILHQDGSLNRSKLADKAFASSEETAKLNAVTHPHIIARTRRILEQLADAGELLAVLEAPLLSGSGLEPLCDAIVVVTAPDDVRLTRIMKRDGLSEAQARQRMAAQINAAEYNQAVTHLLPSAEDAAMFLDVLRQEWGLD